MSQRLVEFSVSQLAGTDILQIRIAFIVGTHPVILHQDVRKSKLTVEHARSIVNEFTDESERQNVSVTEQFQEFFLESMDVFMGPPR